MTSQGLRASSEGIRAAKTALTDKTLSQHKLAIALGITRQPVSKFFAGEPVSRSCFVQICQHLGLSWQKIAALPEDITSDASAKSQTNNRDLNILVQEIRQKRQDKIQDQCGTLQMMDIAQTIPLRDIYTPIYILETITSQRWLEIDDLLQEFNQKKLLGLEVASLYSKLMILGKPGTGKTIFLKYLALECNQGQFQPSYVAIFINLKDFAEDLKDNSDLSLLKYISQEFVSCGIEAESTQNVLTEGKGLIFLDGLDEVPTIDINQVNQEIRRFSQTYYKNRFVISCRIGAQKYKFPGFTEVEIADFDMQQADIFVKQWFVVVAKESKEDGESIGNLFLHQLNLPENKQLRELAIAPILLHLICLFFHTKSEFTFNVAKLYEQALNILLGRWDDVRGIYRQSITENFKLFNPKKLLAQIAAITFEQEDYFFEQEHIQSLISQYLSQFNYYATDLELVNQQLHDSEKWLKIIEVEYGLLVQRSHGIYSFSHLALQEYLTAKNFVINYHEQSVNQLITHITEKRWQNIFLLTVSMLPNAEIMLQLMKQKIDNLVANDQKIQDFFLWLNQKSNSVATQYKAGAIRAFYLVCVGRVLEVCSQASNCPQQQVFGNSSSYGLERAILGNLAFNPELAIDEFLTSTFACAAELEFACHYILNDAIVFDYAHALNIAFDKALNLVIESQFKQFLHNLKKQLPNAQNHPHKFRKWWIEHGKFWSGKFRELLIQYRNICHDWQFSKQQIELIQQYYSANKLLINCLNVSRKITPAIREEIEGTLLLVISEIKS
ncbi:NACHT domain-containing NTPase [Nostoc sp. FACHB-87]|uniref:NACHT domain-containing protein n=1 Tax=Nostocaceae TaxID=1162 RepID=UPI0016824ED0|nr:MULTISPECIES: NACHT domain-containing NTPase [Nostocaceae]MBD2454475.1 NACHT domain-containing NTPase [Nostoc sp. FACHB-87]MBD2474339.1 NACHT domain-containing NTPase [Anabaena sp. FACHB-83]